MRFAINGFGRVGRALLRAVRGRADLEIAAINDVVPAPALARLLARDTVHGLYPGTVEAVPDGLRIEGRPVLVYNEADPAAIPWEENGIDVVVEATGRFLRRADAAAHLRGSIRTVVLTANSDDADVTLCLGLNERALDLANHHVVSNASCTTNCLALTIAVLHEAFGVRRALMNTVHGYTENQRLVDQWHPDPRRSRAAAINVIPTATTAAGALGRVIPDLAGIVQGFATRVPTPAVAMLDLAANLDRDVSVEEVRDAYRRAASGRFAGLLGAVEDELVSSDFIGDPRSTVIDLPLIQVAGGRLARVVAWYDNEWGYAHRLAGLLSLIARSTF
jgi:glyceraldehyde 3-phosphate dehydrogenase